MYILCNKLIGSTRALSSIICRISRQRHWLTVYELCNYDFKHKHEWNA